MHPNEHPVEEFSMHDEVVAFSSLILHEDTPTSEKFHVDNSRFVQSKFHFALHSDASNFVLHVSNMRGLVYHQWRPPDDIDVSSSQLKNDEYHIHSTAVQHQVAYFLTKNFEAYQFDYGGLGKTTCIWIDHGFNELPQLLIIPVNKVKFECYIIEPYFAEYKDKFSFLRTVTITLLLVHALINHMGMGLNLPCLIMSHFDSLCI